MKNKYLKALSIALLLITFYSCDKTEEGSSNTGQVRVGIKSVTTGSDESAVQIGSSNNSARLASTNNVQLIKGSFGPYELEGVLTVNDGNANVINDKLNSKNASSNMVAANPTIEVLPVDIMYRLSVYKTSDGSLVEHKVYKRGATTGIYSEKNTFILDGGVDYTFICYSINSTTAIPPLPDIPNSLLNNAKIVGGNQATPGIDGGSDFMYWKTNKVVTGNENLNIILKHMFTKLTVVLNAPAGGRLWLKYTAVANDSLGRILPFNNRMTTSLNNGTFNSGSVLPINAAGKTLFYNSFSNVTTLTTTPAVFYTGTNATVTTGSISIPNLSLKKSGGTTTRQHMVLSGLSFAPRTNYTLTVNIK